MAAARILVGPFFGSCLQHTKLCLSSTVLSTFSASSSSDVWGFLSATGSRSPSGTFIWTIGHTAAFMTVISVSWSATFAKELKFAAAVAKCEWASHTWSNIPMISLISSCLCLFSGSFCMNSLPARGYSSGMTTSTPPLDTCWWR